MAPQGFIFVADLEDNAEWAGFQSYVPVSGTIWTPSASACRLIRKLLPDSGPTRITPCDEKNRMLPPSNDSREAAGGISGCWITRPGEEAAGTEPVSKNHRIALFTLRRSH